VLLAGFEPHYAWREFAHLVVATALGTDARLVVTLGASPAQTPHTRMPMVNASSASPALANDFGLRRPRYEGITGIVGVLQTELDARSWPAISLQVGVPFYATGATNWKAAAALLRKLEHVTGVPTGHQELAPAVAEWEAMVDDALLESPEGLAMVPRLESAYDRETEQQLPSAGELVEELERFLREQPPGSSES
jgi:predicted ATP-grasp superfamily ATP-dependent carboligase